MKVYEQILMSFFALPMCLQRWLPRTFIGGKMIIAAQNNLNIKSQTKVDIAKNKQ